MGSGLIRIHGRVDEPKEFVEFQITNSVAVFTQKAGPFYPVFHRSGDSIVLIPGDCPTTLAGGEEVARTFAQGLCKRWGH
jgi:hypothetical protein